jgi:hypothetical protein
MGEKLKEWLSVGQSKSLRESKPYPICEPRVCRKRLQARCEDRHNSAYIKDAKRPGDLFKRLKTQGLLVCGSAQRAGGKPGA